jgi:acetyltransferase-like isoleucine patch superfamily enzyme
MSAFKLSDECPLRGKAGIRKVPFDSYLQSSISNCRCHGHGKVKLGDSVWLAQGANMAIGTPIIVTGMRGTVVLVAKV